MQILIFRWSREGSTRPGAWRRFFACTPTRSTSVVSRCLEGLKDQYAAYVSSVAEGMKQQATPIAPREGRVIEPLEPLISARGVRIHYAMTEP